MAGRIACAGMLLWFQAVDGLGGMAKAVLFIVVFGGTISSALAIADLFGLRLEITVMLAIIGALICLAGFILVPRVRRRLAYSKYRDQAFLDRDLIVSKTWYRGNRVLHYGDGSVAALTQRGMRSFESFEDCRSFIDRR